MRPRLVTLTAQRRRTPSFSISNRDRAGTPLPLLLSVTLNPLSFNRRATACRTSASLIIPLISKLAGPQFGPVTLIWSVLAEGEGSCQILPYSRTGGPCIGGSPRLLRALDDVLFLFHTRRMDAAAMK